ncbi:hypothetical protein [Glaesserella sp.]|uniref:hypothetical protein n=1 Tax=Glaesserella sp. TaxID=2094731 RepID=UPI0035A1751A
MKRTTWLFSLCLALSAYADPVAEAWEDANVAMKRGDFQQAVDVWLPLAEKGCAGSQIQLENIFEENIALAKTNLQAVYFFEKIAKYHDSTKLLLARISLAENDQENAKYWLEQILDSEFDSYKVQAEAHLSMLNQ